MGQHHSHDHPQDHSHDHPHSHQHDGELGPELDETIPDAELSPAELGRRSFFRRAGILGAGAATASVMGGALPAAAAGSSIGRPVSSTDGYVWLSGDHHIHTQYSSDGIYRVADHVQHAAAFGLDWMVITDHGSVAHAKIGVDKVHPDIVEARAAHGREILVFQGLEWNIPAAEHGTVFVHPGRGEVAVLKEFENTFDGSVKAATASTPENEALALAGLDFLAHSVTSGRVTAALFLANHPARKGIDSPHEIRGWRDRQPGVAIGMEGAPGHQAAGMPAPYGAASGRGGYDNSPSADSFAGYPPESYVTWGGFDWMTATVGGLWDSLLAEGKPWWITSNSDSHNVWLESSVRGPNSDFDTNGGYDDPVHGTGGPALTNADFWPGYYSRTHVGATGFAYAAVMAGLKAGRVWVDHGRLLDSLDVRVRPVGGRGGATLGSTLTPRRGTRMELAITLHTASLPNWAEFVPELARVDVIRGRVTGPVSDRDVFTTAATRVVKTYDVSGRSGTIELVYGLGAVDEPFYLRVRGSDGKRLQPGLNGAAVDPAGPAVDVLGQADPWQDLWFYSNPIWVLPHR
jgi:PHP domain